MRLTLTEKLTNCQMTMAPRLQVYEVQHEFRFKRKWIRVHVADVAEFTDIVGEVVTINLDEDKP